MHRLILENAAHRLKNTGIKTTQCVSGLKATRRIALTGTPIQVPPDPGLTVPVNPLFGGGAE